MNGNLAYQDPPREELIDGTVTMMAPASAGHVAVSGNIYLIFATYLKGKRCVPFSDGLMVHCTQKDRFIPDFMVVCDPQKIKPDGIYGAPDLVVEVLSPSTAKTDRTYKKDVYEQCGVKEYWLVNPADQSIEVYLLDSGRYILYNIYAKRPDWDLKWMTDEERAAVVTSFQCSLFDDLDIALDDVFYRTF